MAKILIVDDDVDLVDACRMVLHKAGHEVGVGHNVAEGRKAIEQFKPDLLILDVMMEQPDDGIRMAQELRREHFTTPILMLTSIGRVTGMGFDKSSDLVPVDAFQEKPVPPAKLIELVESLLKSAKGG